MCLPERRKKGAELWGSVSIYRGQKTLKNRHGRLGCEFGCILFVKRSKKVCLIITWRSLGESPTKENLALLECRSALQKCQIGSWTPNALLCLGVIWTPLLGFFELSLHLDVFSFSVYDFLSLFLDNSVFFLNYLVDKYPKINLDKVQTIHNFIVIQSPILFLCMHPYFKH